MKAGYSKAMFLWFTGKGREKLEIGERKEKVKSKKAKVGGEGDM